MAEIRPLSGDANRDGEVRSSDLLVPRDFLGQPVTDANAQYDLDANGAILSSDLLIPRDFLGNVAQNCP